MSWLLAIVLAWLVGGIPFGVLIGRARGVDVRQHGSRNIGATNVGRVLGRRWGVLCFLLDAAKGAVPVLVAGAWLGPLGTDPLRLGTGDAWGWLGVATATVAGHMASPWLGLRGGKGVATAAGALAATFPLLTLPVLGAGVTWAATLAAFRYVSLASIAAACSLPLWLAASIGVRLATGGADGPSGPNGGPPPDVAWAALAAPATLVVLVAAAVVIRHRGNIVRLRAGTEPTLGSNRD